MPAVARLTASRTGCLPVSVRLGRATPMAGDRARVSPTRGRSSIAAGTRKPADDAARLDAPFSEPGPLLADLRKACWRHMMRALPVDPTATMRELDFPSLHKVYAKWR